ncbi:MAG: PIG-L family deacetylase [Chlorobi bacterium]|nr:PIG-L family deacetylase [Chlorobiota bacterium]MCI0715456.1 PIG-L family deacetylase [Chlorobiota bacterium]
MVKKFLPLLFVFISLSVFSQNSNFTILCIAAHPDDEDGATLAYYSRIKEYNAYTIFYTRGEGGQNETGPELYDELGKLRERECYEAAEIQGSKAYFLGFLDFGYSKTAKETFRFWGGGDSILERIVYMIRLIRPDVVITNHDTITTKPKRQHGHHQVCGITIYNAFEKASDPNYHPEQLVDGVEPWQIKKLYFRVYDTTRTDGLFSIDVYQKDLSGKTIKQIAIDALSKHRTQGMDKLDWENIPEVANQRRYELVRSDKMYPVEGSDLFEGLEPIEKSVNFELKSYPTIYSYYKVNPEDSLRILKSVKHTTWAVGLVSTYDNTLVRILNAFHVGYSVVTPFDVEKGELSSLIYQTIILDLRAYFYRPDVVKFNEKLLKYVEDGGNLIVFYNKPQDWNGFNFGPFPIYLTNERVTEEDTEVKVLEPYLRLFRSPNVIYESDWDGWVQERSVYLPSDDTLKTSSKYHKLLSMNDENDPVPSTSLLYAVCGSGTYIYCSLALYRQLRVFNEGALKLFMNMISTRSLDPNQSR